MYDYLIVTHLPAFYKVNLYNELAKRKKIKVVFLAFGTIELRSKDFSNLLHANFDYQILTEKPFQKRLKLKSIFKLFLICNNTVYNKIIVGGWDLIEFWLVVFMSMKSKNILALESTIYESKTTGLPRLFKKFFLTRISSVFASGKLQSALLGNLKYKSDIKITSGVGIINKPIFKYKRFRYSKRFLFVGRLSEVKNVKFLITVFNSLPDYQLTVVGGGPLEYLKVYSSKNIIFLGMVDNTLLQDIYLSHDFLILPSLQEPWGLVTEEALYYGLPVLISNKCGSSQLIEHGKNGFIFNPLDEVGLRKILQSIDNQLYQKFLNYMQSDLINIKDLKQIATYDII